jgi:hypothetical protein
MIGVLTMSPCPQLAYCVVQFLEKDPSLTEAVCGVNMSYTLGCLGQARVLTARLMCAGYAGAVAVLAQDEQPEGGHVSERD